MYYFQILTLFFKASGHDIGVLRWHILISVTKFLFTSNYGLFFILLWILYNYLYNSSIVFNNYGYILLILQFYYLIICPFSPADFPIHALLYYFLNEGLMLFLTLSVYSPHFCIVFLSRYSPLFYELSGISIDLIFFFLHTNLLSGI